MEKITIIGCGWLGLPLAEKLVKKNYSVAGTTTSEEKLSVLNEKDIKGKIFTIGDDTIDFQELKESTCVVIAIPPSKIDNYANKIADFCKNLENNQRVIYVSSTSVYADKDQVAYESDVLDGTNRSGPEVIKTEKEIRTILGERLTVVRMSGLVGGDRQPAKYFAGKTDLSGADTGVNMIHQTDAVGVIMQVISSNSFGKTYNGCATEHPTKVEYYTKVCEELNLALPKYSGEPQAFKTVNNDLSISELGYNYTFSDPMKFPLE